MEKNATREFPNDVLQMKECVDKKLGGQFNVVNFKKNGEVLCYLM